MKPTRLKLRQINIAGYRSCEDTRLEISPTVTALIGPNGAGKTSILNALRLLASKKERYTRPDLSDLAFQCTIDAEFSSSRKPIRLRKKLKLRYGDSNTEEVVENEEQWHFGDFGWKNEWIAGNELQILARHTLSDDSPSYLALPDPSGIVRYFDSYSYEPITIDTDRIDRFGPPPKPVITAFNELQNFMQEFRYYSASEFTNPSLCPTSIEIDEAGELVRDYRQSRNSHTRFIHDLFRLQKFEPNLYERYISLVGHSGVRLIDSIEWSEVPLSSMEYRVRMGGNFVNKPVERSLVIPTVEIGRSRLSFSQLSEGTLRTLGLLFYTVAQKGSLLLIEEPEVCVHHGLLSSLIEVIKKLSRESQVVLSTHSDFIVDKLKSSQVLLVQNDHATGTKVTTIPKSMSGKEFQALKNYLSSTGTLGEYWKSGGFDK